MRRFDLTLASIAVAILVTCLALRMTVARAAPAPYRTVTVTVNAEDIGSTFVVVNATDVRIAVVYSDYRGTLVSGVIDPGESDWIQLDGCMDVQLSAGTREIAAFPVCLDPDVLVLTTVLPGVWQ